MGLTTTQIALWYSTFLLELLACALALRKRLYLQLPIFTTYLFTLILRAAFIFAVYRSFGYASPFAFYSYWISEAVLMAGRAGSIGELAWRASRPYAGFRVVLKWALMLLTFVLLAHAAVAAMLQLSRIPAFVLTLERDFELTAAVVLVAFFALTRRYDVPVQTLQRLVAAGLIFYSLVQVTNNEISKYWMESHFHWWEAVRSSSFDVALIIWLIALARPSSPQADQNELVDTAVASGFMTKGTAALHELANQLARFRRKL